MVGRNSLYTFGISRLLATLGVASAAVCAVPAAMAGESVTVVVRGTVEESCEIEVPGQMNVGDISKAGSAETSFGFSCNAPFKVALESRRGGLAQNYRVPAVGNFSEQTDYSVDAIFPFDTGGQINIAGCAASRLTGPEHGHARGRNCGTGSTTNRTAINQTATIRLNWAGSSQPMLAGEYGDVLTLRISSQL